MKILLNICFFLVISIHSFGNDCNTNVNINTDNENNLIFVDGEYIGNGSISLELKLGEHIVKVKEPGLNWDAKSFSKTIVIEDCNSNIDVDINYKKKYLLNTSPQDVYVYENNNLLGNTPLLLTGNPKELSLIKPNYYSKNITFKDILVSGPIELDFSGEAKTEKFRDTPWFNLLIGTAVGIGAISVYNKIQADKSFDKYEETNIKSHLDDTDHYDNISAITFGALQVNFGALIYFLLTD